MIKINNSKILVTGAAGFIGSAVSEKIVNLGFETFGIDNLNVEHRLFNMLTPLTRRFLYFSRVQIEISD